MNQLRSRLVFSGKAVEQPIEMRLRLGAALRGKAGRLVNDNGRVVLVDNQRTDELVLVVGERVPFGLWPTPCLFVLRRNPDDLPGFDPVAGRSALAVDAQLAGARPA